MDRWTDRAACRDADPDLFFPASEDMARRAVARQVARAKAICASCPVWATCLAWAVQNGQDHGVWGGLTARERRRLTRGSYGSADTTTTQEPPDAA